MIHQPKRHPQPLQRPHLHRVAGLVVALMVLALCVYGYQFWWTE